ncbi:hypothetical protein FRC01_009115 [Tulasnella sp. 417]|nr:hypothetical protein FRC01_009115 [Tulasnella sp. 417]
MGVLEKLTAIPGVLEYNGARIQLLDLPGIVEGASQGRGRGRQVVAGTAYSLRLYQTRLADGFLVAKTADVIIVMLDATKSLEQKKLLEIELDAVGIRLNKRKPDVVFKKKTGGGITINATVKLTKIDEKSIRTILQGYKIHNCDLMIREDITVDEFIDVLLGTRKYIPCLYVYNKVDSISLEEVDRLDFLMDMIWEYLNIVKIYTKKRGAHPDLTDPVCLRKGASIEAVCNSIHRSLVPNFKYALVWGKSSRFAPHAQKVSLNHVVQDEDVVCIFTK